jgi:transcriptional regulator GlxA family with amidase domain
LPPRGFWTAAGRPPVGPSALLGQSYPKVSVEPDAICVHDGNVWTSAGVTAAIDLPRALVADDHGWTAAAVVARRLVVYLRRSGGQNMFWALLAAQSAKDEPIRDLLEWLPELLRDALSIPAMAARTHVSERQFSRLFKTEVGKTPAEYVEAVRMENACRLLERPLHELLRDSQMVTKKAPATRH